VSWTRYLKWCLRRWLGTSIVPPGPHPPLADTPGTSSAPTTAQATASYQDFAVCLHSRLSMHGSCRNSGSASWCTYMSLPDTTLLAGSTFATIRLVDCCSTLAPAMRSQSSCPLSGVDLSMQKASAHAPHEASSVTVGGVRSLDWLPLMLSVVLAANS
jgi:hypothetical protein